MRINPVVYGVSVLVVFFGIIFGFQAAGVWSISGKVTASGDQVQPSAADVNSIKGWMTLEKIAATFNVPLADLLAQFDLPGDTPPTTAIKDLETDLFSVTNLRTWLESLNQSVDGIPAPTVDSSQQAIAIQTEPAAVTSTPAPTAIVNANTVTLAATEHVSAEKTITGKTTFQEVIDWGVTTEVIEEVIGGEIPSGSAVIKDYVTGKGMQFTTIKTLLQAEVDKIK
jgi:hypothetical protein